MQIYRLKGLHRGSKLLAFVIADSYQDIERLLKEDHITLQELKLMADSLAGSKPILVDMRPKPEPEAQPTPVAWRRN